MNAKIAALWCAITLGIAGTAQAQETPAAPATVEAAVTAGDQILRTANAADLFINESARGAGHILLRHRASGMVCDFEVGAQNNVVIFPQLARGEDVGCNTPVGAIYLTFYATRYTPAVPLEEQVQIAQQAIRQRYPSPVIRQLANPADFEVPGMPPIQGAAYDTRAMDTEVTTYVIIALVGDWSVKLRATGRRSPTTDMLVQRIFFDRLRASFPSVPARPSPAAPA